MNINALPIVGWLLSFIGNVSLAVPFWICWTVCGIGGLYFDFLPEQWRSIPFWNCVGLFLSVSIIKTVFVPKIASVSQSADSKKD
jgi:hypothetical protein